MLSKKYLTNPKMSQSKLKKIAEGVEEFKYALDHPIEETDAMRLGTAVHLLVLEPHKKDQIVVLPKLNGVTREGKIFNFIKSGKNLSFFSLTTNKVKKQTDTFYEVDSDEHGFAREMIGRYGKIFAYPTDHLFLTEEQFKKAEAMAASVRTNTDAESILNACNDFEIELEYTHKGIDFKCQLDGLGYDCVLDLKTTSIRNNLIEIKREIMSRFYHFQAASYLLPTKRTKYFIIFVRSEAPYAVFPVQLSDELLELGLEAFNDACDKLNDCFDNNPTFAANNRIQLI